LDDKMKHLIILLILCALIISGCITTQETTDKTTSGVCDIDTGCDSADANVNEGEGNIIPTTDTSK